MSSKAENAKEKRKQRPLLASGEKGQVEGAGNGSKNDTGEGSSEVLIPLIQFDLDILGRAREDDRVEVKYQNGHYEVLLHGVRLGNVPSGSYEAKLKPHLVLSARLVQVSNDPPAAKISVQVQ